MSDLRRLTTVAFALLCATAPAAAARPGDLDRSFGNRGVSVTRLLDGGFHGLAQGNGRLLVAGGVDATGVWRLTRSGRRDRSFGRGGIASSTRNGLPFGIRRVGDEIRVGLGTVTTNEPPVALLRFGAGGQALPPAVHEPFLPGPIFEAHLRPDGGAYVNAASGVRAVNPDGSLDTSFSGGTLEPGELPGWRGVRVAAVTDNGQVIATARRSGRPHVLRLYPFGQIDASFGSLGAVRVPFVPLVEVLSNGDLAGYGSRGRFAVRVFKLTRDGRRRFGYGVRGVAGTWRGRRNSFVGDLEEDGRGRLYVLGFNGVYGLSRGGRPLRRFGRRGVARSYPRAPRRHSYSPSDLVADRRRGLFVVGHRYRGYAAHPGLGGCSFIREDFCAEQVAAAVWRLRL